MPILKKVNKRFFKKWTPQMAYVLGFFLADGSMDVSKRGTHYFSFHICDGDLLKQIKKVLGSEHKISHTKRRGNERDQYRLQIGSREMCDDLRKLKIKEQKTYNLILPPVPLKYFRHLLRGYFDGDGNVWTGISVKKRKKQTPIMHVMFTSGSEKFLKILHRRLKKYGIQGGGVYCKDRGFCLKYATRDSLILYSLLYRQLGKGLYLARKKKVFDRFIKKRKLMRL